MSLENIITFAEASEIWKLSKGTLNKAVGKKLIEDVDCRKSSNTWLVTKEAMIREYGTPDTYVKIENDSMFMKRNDFCNTDTFVKLYDALDNSKNKEIEMPWLSGRCKLEKFTLLDFRMFKDIVSYTIILKLKNKYGECTRVIPNVVFFREYDKDENSKYWSFDCLNENTLAYIQKYVYSEDGNRVYFMSDNEVIEGMKNENKDVRECIEDNMLSLKKLVLPK